MKEQSTILKLSRFEPAAPPSGPDSVTSFVRTAVRETDAPLVKPNNACASAQSLLGLVTYCYTKGVYDSGEIESKLRKANSANETPDAGIIRRFRRLNRGALQSAIEKTLSFIRHAGRQETLRPAAEEKTEIVTRREAAQKLEIAALVDVSLDE